MTILTGTLNASGEDLIRYVRTVLPDVTLETAEQELLNVLRDFFTRSNAWFEIDTQPIDSDATYYEIGAPASSAEISAVLAVAQDGRPLSGWSGHYSTEGDSSLSPAATYTTNPDQHAARAITTIKFRNPISGGSGSELQVTVALRPRRNSGRAPEQLIQQYFDALAHGMISRLQSYPDRPFTHLQESDRRNRIYLGHLGRARANMLSRFSMLTGPWCFPQMAPGRGRV